MRHPCVGSHCGLRDPPARSNRNRILLYNLFAKSEKRGGVRFFKKHPITATAHDALPVPERDGNIIGDHDRRHLDDIATNTNTAKI